MYTQEDLRRMSIEELINLINQITDERDMYRRKCQDIIRQQENNKKLNQLNIEYKKKNN